jgi:hypothetical protein
MTAVRGMEYLQPVAPLNLTSQRLARREATVTRSWLTAPIVTVSSARSCATMRTGMRRGMNS